MERLFSSSLVAVVSLSAPRKLKVCHFKVSHFFIALFTVKRHTGRAAQRGGGAGKGGNLPRAPR